MIRILKIEGSLQFSTHRDFDIYIHMYHTLHESYATKVRVGDGGAEVWG